MKAGVVGAGLMGTEIALVFALGGHDALLHDRSEGALAAALGRVGAILDKGVSPKFYSPEAARAALTRIEPVNAVEAMSDCALVTEAVFESIDAKAAVLRALHAACEPSCIFASNTSTIPISTLASFLVPDRRARFLGTHYFSPVSRMRTGRSDGPGQDGKRHQGRRVGGGRGKPGWLSDTR